MLAYIKCPIYSKTIDIQRLNSLGFLLIFARPRARFFLAKLDPYTNNSRRIARNATIRALFGYEDGGVNGDVNLSRATILQSFIYSPFYVETFAK